MDKEIAVIQSQAKGSKRCLQMIQKHQWFYATDQPPEAGRDKVWISPRASRGSMALSTPSLQPTDTDFGLLASRTLGGHFWRQPQETNTAPQWLYPNVTSAISQNAQQLQLLFHVGPY